jgi:hypothetical protein
MHFLLDTNIFVDFVKDTKDEHFIEQIIKLAAVTPGRATLLLTAGPFTGVRWLIVGYFQHFC